MRRTFASLVAVALIGSARADECTERVDWIRSHLDRTASHARTWAWGWGIGLSVTGAVQLAIIPFDKPENRVDWITGGVSSFVGVLPILIAPPKAIALAGSFGGDCASLPRAERALRESAADERFNHGPVAHIANVLFNLGIAAFLGFGYHHWVTAAVSGLGGIAVGEVMIFTLPSSSIADERAYGVTYDVKW